jgi:hypothetical protein
VFAALSCPARSERFELCPQIRSLVVVEMCSKIVLLVDDLTVETPSVWRGAGLAIAKFFLISRRTHRAHPRSHDFSGSEFHL